MYPVDSIDVLTVYTGNSTNELKSPVHIQWLFFYYYTKKKVNNISVTIVCVVLGNIKIAYNARIITIPGAIQN